MKGGAWCHLTDVGTVDDTGLGFLVGLGIIGLGFRGL